VRTWHELLALVAASQGVALLTASIAQYYSWSDVRFVPVDDLPPVPVALIWRRADQHSPLRGLVTRSLRGTVPGPRRPA
jgi:DNA-binding transcriptional LysR family regulator